MSTFLKTTRNLLVAATLALIGFGFGPGEVVAAEWECVDSDNCTSCSDGDCIYSCCGSCDEVIIMC